MLDAQKKEHIKAEAISWLKTIAVAIVLYLIIANFIIVNATIPTGSMENTIMTGDRLIAFRLSYVFSPPERGDIVVFRSPEDNKTLLVKRIIGLPGETLEGTDGVVYIDGEPLAEGYILEPADEDFGPFSVPESSYFMMGDNRNNSLDARFWEQHYVNEDLILGKAVFGYYPKFKVLTGD